jgi:hypothetical protein
VVAYLLLAVSHRELKERESERKGGEERKRVSNVCKVASVSSVFPRLVFHTIHTQ